MRRRELVLAGGSLAAIALYSKRAVASVRELTPIELPEGFRYPNGIARDRGGTIYVGTVLSGKIVKVQPEGQIETLFAGNEEIFAITSLRIDESRNILWGTSPDVLGTPQANGEIVRRAHRIFAIDSRTGEVLQAIQMPDGGFGNDIALDADGGVYLTDSVRPRIHYLPPGADKLQTWAEDERFKTKLRFGLSGIARRRDGTLFVTMYSDGRMFQVTPSDRPKGSARSDRGNPIVAEVALPRQIDGADGIQFTEDGSLLAIEGGIEGENGRLLRLSELDGRDKPKLEVLASGMNLPVNLTVAGQEVWVTESLFRHRLVPGRETEIPDRFFIRRFELL